MDPSQETLGSEWIPFILLTMTAPYSMLCGGAICSGGHSKVHETSKYDE